MVENVKLAGKPAIFTNVWYCSSCDGSANFASPVVSLNACDAHSSTLNPNSRTYYCKKLTDSGTCSTCNGNKTISSSTTCTTCSGTGYRTGRTSCSHSYTSAHYYCNQHNWKGSTSYHT